MSKLYLMCGISGSGKSTYADNIENCVVIHRDNIRNKLYKDNYFNNENLVYKTFINQINACIDSGKDVCADATNITVKSRSKLLDKLHIDDVNIIVIYMNTPYDICKYRNSLRQGFSRVPDDAVESQYKNLQIPTYNEKYHYADIIVKNYE